MVYEMRTYLSGKLVVAIANRVNSVIADSIVGVAISPRREVVYDRRM
jgi:hypothetical protein